MFILTEEELNNAFHAIEHHGYSTMLPEPLEWLAVRNNWDEVRVALTKIDLDNYVPYEPMRVFAPKNRANIRITHLLHPQDILIYTALTLIVKNDIEGARVTKKSRRVFSYRVDLKNSSVLYVTKGAHEDYLGQLKSKSEKDSVKFIGIADIADFYPRIYQHRLENVIESISSDQRGVDVARVLVKKFISKIMGGISYGIPVGPYASRVLAEAVLIDVDANLQTLSVDFVRWVDDYTIFCKSEYEAQSTLFALGEWLFANHGLTLQSAKTKILPKARFVDEVLAKPEDQLSERDHAVHLLKMIHGDYDDFKDEDLDENEVAELLHSLQGFDLKGMLEQSISDKSLVDYEIVTYVLSKLQRIPGVPSALKDQILDTVIENAELLYPAAEHIAKYVVSFEGLTPSKKKKIAGKLLKPLKSKRTPPPEYYAMWVLHVFTTSQEWNHLKDIISLYSTVNSEVIKRYAALAIAVGGSRSEVLAIKGDYVSASPLLKTAIIAASGKLGKDERKHWKLTVSVNGIIEKRI